jgi:GT2 family glycosyltransferase
VELKQRLTVVIPAYNEECYIENILRDLSTQIYATGILVYVADGGSTDRTVEICKSAAEEYKEELRIRVIEGGSVTRGRNAGLDRTETEYVVFIDSDVRLTNPFQLFNVWYHLSPGKLIGAPLISTSGFPSNLVYSAFNAVNRLICRKRPFALGSFFATHTETLKDLGGWDETIIHGEDWVLSGKYSAKKYTPCDYPIAVDDRRFKRTGYLGMLWLMLKSAIKGPDYMRKDHGYWN